MNQIDWSKLVDLEYWFEGVAGTTAITPPLVVDSVQFKFLLVLFSLFFGVGVLLFFAKTFLNKYNPLLTKFDVWGNNFLWMGILGSFWLFLRQAEVGFLGARMWLLVGVVWLIILGYLIIKYFVSVYPLERAYFLKHHNANNK